MTMGLSILARVPPDTTQGSSNTILAAGRSRHLSDAGHPLVPADSRAYTTNWAAAAA